MTTPRDPRSAERTIDRPMPALEDETRWEQISANLKTVGGAVLLALVIRTCLFEPFEIEGPSMEPTLLNGDRVVVSKFAFGLFLPFADEAVTTWGVPELGDVVIVKSPADGVDIVKRVVALPGDTIALEDDELVRNGELAPSEDVGRCEMGSGANQVRCRWYETTLATSTFRTSAAHASMDQPELKVPPGHVFVMGDHRDQSNDSRNPAVGPVPISRIKGKALAIYWSGGPENDRMSRMFQGIQ